MASVGIKDIRKAYGSTEVIHGDQCRDRGWRIRHARRAVGLRQVDAAAHDRGPRGDLRGRDPDRRARGQRRAAEGARHRHGVPELCALPAYDGRRQHGLLAEAQARAEGRDREHASTRRPAFSGCSDSARALSAPALGRPAPARRHGPRHRARSAGLPVRRAALQSRRQAARRRCAPRSRSCTSASRPRRSTSRTTRSRP